MQTRFALFLLTAAAFAVPTFAAPVPTAPAAPASPAAPAKAADGDAVSPAQSTVAAKTAFGTVPAADKTVTAALDAKALAEALKEVGHTGAFQGTVSAVYSPEDNDVTVLDFAPHFHDAVTAAAKPDAYAKLPDLKSLVGKHVLISGTWSKTARGVAQIALTKSRSSSKPRQPLPPPRPRTQQETGGFSLLRLLR